MEPPRAPGPSDKPAHAETRTESSRPPWAEVFGEVSEIVAALEEARLTVNDLAIRLAEQVTALQEAQEAVIHLQGTLEHQARLMQDSLETVAHLERKVADLTVRLPAEAQRVDVPTIDVGAQS